MKSNKLAKKVPYLIIFSILLFVLTGCSNLTGRDSKAENTNIAETQEEESNNPVFKALAAKIDE